MKIYPGAHMCFDMEGMDKIADGHRLLYDPVATTDAIDQVKNFLARYVK